MALSQRERLLITVLIIVLVAGAALMGFRAVRDYQAGLEAEIQAVQTALRQAAQLSEEMRRLRAAPRAEPLRQPLLSYVERLSRQAGLADRLQLNLIPQERASAVEAVEVKLDNLTLDETVGIVHTLESARPPLVIDQFEVTPSFRARDLLRVTLRVLAQK
jgi:hypothetical protein